MVQMKTRGLIIKTINLNDNDRIFTVLTTEGGKITVMAKGIRSQKHKCFAAMQLFCLSDFVFERKTGMYYPVTAQLCENFFSLRDSVEKVALATYISDIVNAIPDEFPVEDEYFRFILNTLYMISKTDAGGADFKCELCRLKAIFELKTACEFGYMPECAKCGICGTNKNIEYFDITSGFVLCRDCNEGEKTGTDLLVPIIRDIHAALYRICNADSRAVFAIKMPPGICIRLSEITAEYLAAQTDIAPTSAQYFENLVN